MRRRQLEAMATSVIVLAALAGACQSPTEAKPSQQQAAGPRSESPPADPATAADGAARPARPLTYAEGQTIHLGDRTIDTGVDLLSLDLTDDGVAFTTFDGLLWFTDGATIDQIGATSPGRQTGRGVQWGPAGRPNDRIVSDNSGSRLAWLEYPELDRPEIVVYDSHERRRVARVPIEQRNACERCTRIISVRGDDVYWTDSLQRGFGSSELSRSKARLFRYQVSSGKNMRVSVSSYGAGLRSSPRMLVVGDSLETGTVEDGINQDFAFIGRRLVAGGRGTGRPTFDPVTGRQLLIRPPARLGYGFGAAERLYLFQWLDDDRFALLDGTAWNSGEYSGEDLLVCSISHGRCTVAVRRPRSAGSPIVPELGSPGAELAQARAAGESVSGS